MHFIYIFSTVPDVSEFIVISDKNPNDVIAQYENGNYRFIGMFQIQSNARLLPCDKRLTCSE